MGHAHAPCQNDGCADCRGTGLSLRTSGDMANTGPESATLWPILADSGIKFDQSGVDMANSAPILNAVGQIRPNLAQHMPKVGGIPSNRARLRPSFYHPGRRNDDKLETLMLSATPILEASTGWGRDLKHRYRGHTPSRKGGAHFASEG